MSLPASDLVLLGRHAPGSAVALAPDRTISAADLCAHVAGVASVLPEAGDDDKVLVMCRDRHRFAVALLAAWQKGFRVALPPSAQVDAIEAVRRTGMRTVIHDVDGIDRGIDVRAASVIQAARGRVGSEPFAPIGPFPAARPLATLHTSGSTGPNVACEKTAGQLLGEALAIAQAFDVGPGARVLPMVPAHHIYGLLFGVLVPLAGGGAYHRGTPLHASEVASMAREADVLVSVPAHLRALLPAAPTEMPRVRRVFSSGAPLPPNVAEELSVRFGWTVTEVFGSTETGGIAWRDGSGPWTPLPGVRVSADPEERILLESPFLHPSEPSPYTGADRVQMLEGGRFMHLGRADGVLKVGGVRVSIAEVEAKLLAIEGVRDAAAIGVEVEGPRAIEVWAAVVAPELSVRELRARLLRWLAPVAVPRRIKRVDALPREANGKLSRRALEALFSKKGP